MKQSINIKAPDHTYERDIMMSGHIAVPRERYRRLIITEVLAWGISGFILIVSLIR
jgi:uncharacterized membrane protein